MPSVSDAQRKFMSAAAHNPAFAKKAGIPVSVAREFHAADAGKKYGAGSDAHRRVARALLGRRA